MIRAKRRVVLYLAISLDGCIADEKGGVDWLEAAAGEEDYGYSEFYDGIDTLIMGRATYDQVLSFGEWPYEGKECHVLSRSRSGDAEHGYYAGEDIHSLVSELVKREGKDIWLVGGAQVAETFMAEHLIDRYIISIVPVVLGRGIKLFRDGATPAALRLEDLRRYGDLAQLWYVPV